LLAFQDALQASVKRLEAETESLLAKLQAIPAPKAPDMKVKGATLATAQTTLPVSQSGGSSTAAKKSRKGTTKQRKVQETDEPTPVTVIKATEDSKVPLQPVFVRPAVESVQAAPEPVEKSAVPQRNILPTFFASVQAPKSASSNAPETKEVKTKSSAASKTRKAKTTAGAVEQTKPKSKVASREAVPKKPAAKASAVSKKPAAEVKTVKKSKSAIVDVVASDDWSKLSVSSLKRKTVKDLLSYLEAKVCQSNE
jgi:hypothetical protein